MNRSTRHIARQLLQALAKLEFEDLIPHRLKRLSRRFLGVGFVVASAIHLIVGGAVYWYGFLEPTIEDMIELTPYPPLVIEVLVEDTPVTDEKEVEMEDERAPAATQASPPVLESEMTEMVEINPVEASSLMEESEIPEPEEFALAEIPPPTEALPPSEMNETSEPEDITPIELPPPVDESAIAEADEITTFEVPEPFEELAISEPHEITSFEIPPPVEDLAISEVHAVTTFELPTPIEEAAISEAHAVTTFALPEPVEDSAISEVHAVTTFELPTPIEEAAISEAHAVTTFALPEPVEDSVISEVHAITTFELPMPMEASGLSDTHSITTFELPTPMETAGLSGIHAVTTFALPSPVEAVGLAGTHAIATPAPLENDGALAGGGTGESVDEDGSGGDGVMAELIGEVGKAGAVEGDRGEGSSSYRRFDTPPVPRRVDISISRNEIPGNLRHVNDSLVKFELLINEVGEVSEAKIVESTGYDEIDALLLAKIYTSWYHPATLRGEAVTAWIVVGYGYRVGK